MITACKDCAERKVGCHGSCELYARQKLAEERMKKLKRDELRNKDYFYGAERSRRLGGRKRKK